MQWLLFTLSILNKFDCAAWKQSNTEHKHFMNQLSSLITFKYHHLTKPFDSKKGEKSHLFEALLLRFNFIQLVSPNYIHSCMKHI